MRNYYDALGLHRLTAALGIRQAVDAMPSEQLADENDLQSVMLNDHWRDHYNRTHLQYEAIAAALTSPAMQGADNSHNWDQRVVEFEPIQDTIEIRSERN